MPKYCVVVCICISKESTHRRISCRHIRQFDSCLLNIDNYKSFCRHKRHFDIRLLRIDKYKSFYVPIWSTFNIPSHISARKTSIKRRLYISYNYLRQSKQKQSTLIEHNSPLPKVRGFDLKELFTNQFTRFHHMTI